MIPCIVVTLRAPASVLGRLACLGAVIGSAHLEVYVRDGLARDVAEPRRAQVMAWFARQHALPTPREAALLARPFCAGPVDEIAHVFWGLEAAAALLWSLQRLEPLPPYTTAADGNDVLARIFSAPPTQPAELRDSRAIGDQRELAQFWHWRARTEAHRRRGMPAPPGDSYPATVARAVASMRSSGKLDALATVEDDVAVDGTPYAEASPERSAQLLAIAEHRHRALAWLVSDADWDDVDTST